MRRRLHDADEQAAFTAERKHLIWKPGQRKAFKKRANRRDRRAARQST